MEAGWYWVKWWIESGWSCGSIDADGWLQAGVSTDIKIDLPAIIGPRIEPPGPDWKLEEP